MQENNIHIPQKVVLIIDHSDRHVVLKCIGDQAAFIEGRGK